MQIHMSRTPKDVKQKGNADKMHLGRYLRSHSGCLLAQKKLALRRVL